MPKQMPPLWIQTTRQPSIVAHSGFNVSTTLRDRRTPVMAADSKQTMAICFGTASPLVRHLLGAQADMMIPRLILYVVLTMAYLRPADKLRPECPKLGPVYNRGDKPRNIQRLFTPDHGMRTSLMIDPKPTYHI
jgi:hypothetical protein